MSLRDFTEESSLERNVACYGISNQNYLVSVVGFVPAKPVSGLLLVFVWPFNSKTESLF